MPKPVKHENNDESTCLAPHCLVWTQAWVYALQVSIRPYYGLEGLLQTHTLRGAGSSSQRASARA